MVNEELSEAEKKLIFADFLLNREDTEPYNNAAIRHVVEASRLAVKSLTNLEEDSIKSPQLLRQTLSKFEEKEPRDFAKFYISFLQSVSKGTAKKSEIQNALRRTRDFIAWIKERK